MHRRPVFAGLIAAFVLTTGAHAQGTRLLRHPAVSRDLIAFEYGGDLWVVPHTGGAARRLTSTPEMETDPQFSPDGSMIAFSRTSGGNTDVCVVSVNGGEPRRLTFHPGPDRVRGWTPDGKRVIFATDRISAPQVSYLRLFSVPADGGFEEPLPMPRAFTGAYSPDAKRIAYEEIASAFTPDWYETSMWRHYRGGRTHPIRIMSLADFSVEKLPWKDSNDSDPMWVGNTIYFLSDRAFTTNLFSYRTDTKELKQLTHHDDADIMNASASADAVVYEQAGYLHLLNVKDGASHQLNIQVNGDFPWARPQFKRVATMIRDAALSPTGVRAAFEARGEIFTVPAEKGDARNLTRSSDADERTPAWSPDGTQLAWLSDASGEYQVMIGDQLGMTKPRAIALPTGSFYQNLTWSPNGKEMVLDDNHLNLRVLDVATGKTSKIDVDTWAGPGRAFDAVWSPDSKWVAYSKNLESHLRAIFVHSVADGKGFQLTDGLADAVSPAFDANGKYLYFLASTDYGPRTGWLEMSALDRPVRRSAYLVVLSSEEPSPMLPESSEEPGAPAAPPPPRPRADSGVKVETPPVRGVRIDEAGIRQRILSVNIPAGELNTLVAGSAGSFFYLEPEPGAGPGGGFRLQRYQLKERAAATFLDGVRSFNLSADKKKLLYSAGGGANARWGVVSTERPAKVGDGPLNVAQLETWVDPQVEWAEIFRESWRTQRDYLYDAKMHGADWQKVLTKYSALLPFVRHRADLGYLIAQTGGELVVGHSYLTGRGDEPADTPVSVGLLGADFAIENGRYRIKKIFSGENWNPELRAPLSAPGVKVAAGDYLLEVNGRALAPPTNVYELFEGTAGHQVVLRLNGTPSLEGSRLITVVPVPSEEGLRTRAWIEDNRRKVDELSGGKLAYVWLPNTGGAGYTSFTRYFYAQQNKDGAIVDERYNHGGLVADYIVNELDRKKMGYFAMRDGALWTSPGAGIYGPKVMLINESAGSGGDALPYYFKLRQIGPLVGTRTWGGLVGTTGSPTTIDGGGITAPSLAFFNLKNQWDIENIGVSPDIEVEYTAADVIKGHDPQLERAVQEGLRLLQQNPVAHASRPPPIDRTSNRQP
ncbi:MAG: PDZ domain-containing protein [Gemmatimonadota bacterium]|nr:PDZ domain-containing protein [Gemmatimonadota bacterium]